MRETLASKQLLVPSGIDLSIKPKCPTYIGKEATVIETFTKANKKFALKWYDSLAGRSQAGLLKYAHEVKNDEKALYATGLTPEQVPPSHFFIAEQATGFSGLYAIQPWIEGKTLKETKPRTVFNNPSLRTSLADLYLKCARVYTEAGLLPDLTGGDRITLLGKSIPDPRKVVWPLRTTNIMVSEDQVLFFDARTHHVEKGSVKYYGIKLHRLLTIGLAKGIYVLNALENRLSSIK